MATLPVAAESGSAGGAGGAGRAGPGRDAAGSRVTRRCCSPHCADYSCSPGLKPPMLWVQPGQQLFSPQEFLKKEFSAENVYFWQACERFQQIPEARRIYDEFLSSHSVSPVNIDRQAWIGEDMLATPSPDMFRLQQLQIFNLMKFDSYTRFVKSPLYQACLTAESQGQPLPDLRPHSRSSSPPPDLSKVHWVSRGHGPIPGPVTSLRDGDTVWDRAAPMLSFLLFSPEVKAEAGEVSTTGRGDSW
uniref:Regulator of G protein signaling 14 n=1 Tax=Coturnix japonica TaxID=93934 RepID=A0A8C2TBF7_COTJA